ncbi:junction-mediating and -regulatory protein-like [Pecten maximus]|uniref:junction-mediating and -regulatory protein-like n=1 Tax=Pecten maximus TaxID=6579 RepID=UPI001457EE41|nr:junction-mediating and -regulatory protein-like [Pecten maximus]
MKPKPTGLKTAETPTKSLKSDQVNEKPRVGSSTNWMAELSNKLQNLGHFSDQENSADEKTSGQLLSLQSNQQKHKSGRKNNGPTGNLYHSTVKRKSTDDSLSRMKCDVPSPNKRNLQNGVETEHIASQSPPPSVPPPPPPAPPPPPILAVTSGKKQVVKPAIISKDLPQPSRATNRGLQCGIPPTENMDNSPLLVKSKDLRDQREVLHSTSKPHPSQLHDLRHVKKSTMVSIAEILKKAVSSRRMALGEDPNSPPQSVASSWSLMDD